MRIKGFLILSVLAMLFATMTTCAFAQEGMPNERKDEVLTELSGKSADELHMFINSLCSLDNQATALVFDIKGRVSPVKQEWADVIAKKCDGIKKKLCDEIKISHDLIVAGSRSIEDLEKYELVEKGFQGDTFIAKVDHLGQRLDLFETDGETPVNFKYIPLSRIVDGRRVVSVYAVAYTGYDGSGYSVLCDADLYDGERKENGIVINLGLIKRGTHDSAKRALINDGMPEDQINQLFPNHMISQN